MIRFWNAFTKITAWPVQFLCFRTKVYYEDKTVQNRRIKGPAIIISNHTSVFDYAVFMFVFFSRTLRYQMAEVLFKKKLLGWFLKRLGGIYIDRNSNNYEYITKSQKILEKGGIVGIFPEGRLPKEGEVPPIEFKTGFAYLALSSNINVIPVYTNGSYFNKKRAKVVIGKPTSLSDLYNKELSEKDNLINISSQMRDKVIELGKIIDGKS